jgi:ABC-type nitrate/sulfonate/bicarbonate transport system substrate-binding protein
MRLALGRLGIDPNVDVKLVPVGNTADALAALSKGVVQFSILVEPFVREAEKFGYKSLIDIGSLNIPFHWNAVLTRQTNVQSKSRLIAKFARAMVEAVHIYKTDKESTLKIISKYTQITGPDPCILSSSQNLVYFRIGNDWGKTDGHKYRREAAR